MINLKKNESIRLEEQDFSGKVNVKLSWKTAIDLDMHCLVKDKYGEKEHIYFGNKRGEYARLDQDAGIGDRAGRNEENMTLHNMNDVEQVLFYIDIFGKSQMDFARYKAKLEINFSGKIISMDLTDTTKGKYFVICAINQGQMINIDTVSSVQPNLSIIEREQIKDTVEEVKNKATGLFSKIINMFK